MLRRLRPVICFVVGIVYFRRKQNLATAKATTASVVSSNGTFLWENREKTNIICGGRWRRMAAVVIFVIGTHTYLFCLFKPKNYGKKTCECGSLLQGERERERDLTRKRFTFFGVRQKKWCGWNIMLSPSLIDWDWSCPQKVR